MLHWKRFSIERILLLLISILFLVLISLIILILTKRSSSTSTSTSSTKCSCGCSKFESTKIINGQPAENGVWPWMVSFGPKRFHHCGGALITNEFILTAAHCFDTDEPIDISKVEIRIGLTDLLNVTKENLYAIETLFLHHQFDRESYANDIALIRLDRPVFSILPICLPDVSSSDYPPIGRQVVAIGWGHVDDPLTSPLPTKLQQTSLPVLPLDYHQENRSWFCFDQEIDRPSEQFCAGFIDGHSDTCQGDSGSPLMFFVDQHWQIVGLVSYGTGCAQERLPGIYTRVSNYVEWIKDRI